MFFMRMLCDHLVLPLFQGGQGVLEGPVGLSDHTQYKVGLGDQLLQGHHCPQVLLYGRVVPVVLVYLKCQGQPNSFFFSQKTEIYNCLFIVIVFC